MPKVKGIILFLMMLPVALSLTASTTGFSCEDSRTRMLVIQQHGRTFNFQHTPKWSTDGSRIKFWKYSSSADGSHVDELGDPWPEDEYLHEFYADLSPDGSRVAYTTYDYGAGLLGMGDANVEIAVSALDGSERRRLTKSQNGAYVPVWSPDGRRIAFVSAKGDGQSAGFELNTMEADGSQPQSLVSSLQVSRVPPAWSPNGRLLAFLGREEIEGPSITTTVYLTGRFSRPI